MYLHLSHELQQQILEHARADYPHEACGLLAGSDHRVERVIPVENVAEDPRHGYMIGRDAFNEHLPALGDLRIIGFYHSHPTGDITPSPTDIRDALPDVIYVIASRDRLAAWRMDRGRVYAVEIYADSVPKQDETLTYQQKAAIIFSMMMALAILIVLSLALLPPAPELP